MTEHSEMPQPTERSQASEHAFSALLRAWGVPMSPAFEGTVGRVAALWSEHLLAGMHTDVPALLQESTHADAMTPVSALDMGVHLICPHHLTVALGRAHVAYQPGPRIVGFGTLSILVRACTARLILQEEAGDMIAHALVNHLQAQAAVAVIEAMHPCHNVLHARSHTARALTVAHAGDTTAAASLKDLLLAGLRRTEWL